MLHKWYVDRFLTLRETAFRDPKSYFHRYSKPRRRGGDRDRDLDLGAHQPGQPARKHPADAPARRPDPEEGREATWCRKWRCGSCRLAPRATAPACRSRTSASRSRSSGFTRKSSMPAARQASRSSPKALAVSAMIGVRGRPLRGFGGADAARRLDAVELGHVHVHQHEIVGRAGVARRSECLDRRGAVRARRSGRWPSRCSRARASSALISLSSATRIAQARRRRRVVGFRRRRRRIRRRGRRRREARRERSGAHRLHQIAGEARLLERRRARAARPA